MFSSASICKSLLCDYCNVSFVKKGWASVKSWFDSIERQENDHFSKGIRPALGPTQTPIQWATILRLKRPRRDPDHSSNPVSMLRMSVTMLPLSHTFSWRPRDRFIFTSVKIARSNRTCLCVYSSVYPMFASPKILVVLMKFRIESLD
jgi:hypothetical protein